MLWARHINCVGETSKFFSKENHFTKSVMLKKNESGALKWCLWRDRTLGGHLELDFRSRYFH